MSSKVFIVSIQSTKRVLQSIVDVTCTTLPPGIISLIMQIRNISAVKGRDRGLESVIYRMCERHTKNVRALRVHAKIDRKTKKKFRGLPSVLAPACGSRPYKPWGRDAVGPWPWIAICHDHKARDRSRLPGHECTLTIRTNTPSPYHARYTRYLVVLNPYNADRRDACLDAFVVCWMRVLPLSRTATPTAALGGVRL